MRGYIVYLSHGLRVALLAGLFSPAVCQAEFVVFDFGSDPGKTSTTDFADVVSLNGNPDSIVAVSDEPDGLALRSEGIPIEDLPVVGLTLQSPLSLAEVDPMTDRIVMDIRIEPGHRYDILDVQFGDLETADSSFTFSTVGLSPGKHRLIGDTFFGVRSVIGIGTDFDPGVHELKQLNFRGYNLGLTPPPTSLLIQIDRIAFVPEPATCGLVVMGLVLFPYRSRHR